MEFKIVSFAFFTISLFLIISFPLISSSPFGFLKNLQGCHKGDKVQGLHNLKNYLYKFCYLSNDMKDDNFDDTLELAIKTYQVKYNLDPTGILDASTVALMSKPRCGVPDITNCTTWMESSKNHHNNQGHIHTVSHYTFFNGTPRWSPSKYHLSYTFQPSVPNDAKAPVTRAFGTWAANTQFTFTQTNDQNADLKIGFEIGVHGDSLPFDGPGGTVAHAFGPPNGNFHYDANDSFSVGGVGNLFDYETVALHEIGHLLGLDHSSVQEAIMWSVIPPGQTKGLYPDDIAGIKDLYNNP